MDNTNRTITVKEEIRVLTLKVKVGTMIYDGAIVLIYEPTQDSNNEPGSRQKKLKSSEAGVVRSIFVREGDVVSAGSVILELEKKCNHPTVIKDLCAECGADLQKENEENGKLASQASVSMVHMVPELKVNEELAQILGKADMDRLLEFKKLVLLVDLDQTLIHTTNDNIPNNIKNVYHFQLYGPQSLWYHTKLRPGTHEFLQGINEKYELHICTFGSRRYAHMITRFLDPDGRFFSHRILSRDECFDPNSKTANLKALFPCGENMVCIIDDREDVWDYASNLIHVKPYHFFQHTGDIHAPPGLGKCENDDGKQGFNFSEFNNETQTEEANEYNESADSQEAEDSNHNDPTEVEEAVIKTKVTYSEEDNIVEKFDEKEIIDSKLNTSMTEEQIMIKMEDVKSENDASDGHTSKNDGDAIKLGEHVPREEPHSFEGNASQIVKTNVEEESSPQESLNTEIMEEDNLSEAVKTEVQEGNQVSTGSVLLQLENQIEKLEVKLCDYKNDANGAFLSNSDTDKFGKISDTTQNKNTVDMLPRIESDGTIVGALPSDSDTDKFGEISDTIQNTNAVHMLPRIESDGMIVIEEKDDYLLYLEEILKIIHREFFKRYEQTGVIPDLKVVVPETRAKVLKGVNIVFSGIIPNRMKLEDSQAYKIATSLGAKVTQNIEPDTTHLVAYRAGTIKTHAAAKRKNIKLVTPEWLWTCAERWEKVDERLFPLESAKPNAELRHPPAHCRSPEHPEPLPFTYQTTNKYNPSSVSDFMSTINPLMSLSSEDIQFMEGEVEDICRESEGEMDETSRQDDDEMEEKDISVVNKRKYSSSSSSSEKDVNWDVTKKPRKKRFKEKHEDVDFDVPNDSTQNCVDADDDTDDSKSSSTDDESINSKFRRGENLPSDLDIDYSNEEGTEEESDGEWNVMGAAVEREFLDDGD